jgi:hypothetical protein
MATYVQLYQEVAANFTTTVTGARRGGSTSPPRVLTGRRWSFLETTSAAVALVASQQAYVISGTTPVISDFAA